jgi:predicted amidohydrolase YtcJ
LWGVHASLLLVNGRIITQAGRGASALAAVGDRIVAVGEDHELLPLRGARTQALDLRGRTVVPGFTDSHLHLASLATRLATIDLHHARSLVEAQRRVAARAATAPPGQWLIGGGFDKNRWGDRFPTRHDLDAVAPDHPVALSSHDGHTMWLNSAALRESGLTRRTRCPANGVIFRDPQGRPTGILQEAAIGLLDECASFQAARRPGRADLARATRYLVRLGVTSVHAMDGLDTFSDLQGLRAQGRLGPRVTLYAPCAETETLAAARLRSGFGDEWLRLGGVKVMCDGALGSQTAWLCEPYQNCEAVLGAAADGYRGVPVTCGEELRQVVRRAAEAGLACAVHAIGDCANADVLDAFAAASRLATPLPHRVEHAQLLRPADLPRFAQQGVIASMQPVHLLADVPLAERYWGTRGRWAYACHSLARRRAVLAFGSDAPIETPDPLAGLRAAVFREARDAAPGESWYPEERLTLAAALHAYTVGPARATGEAALKGRLAPGYLADAVVLSNDPRTARGLRAARVDVVVVGGKLEYHRA